MSLSIGDQVPAFSLNNTDGEAVSNESLLGKKTLIMFFPFAFSGTCTGEICQLRDRADDVSDLDAQVVAITCDPKPANAAWAAANNFDHPVLTDFWPHGEVSKAFGIFNDGVGVANRVTFVVNETGVVTDIVASDSMPAARDFDAQLNAVKAI